jgi:hypothetical protein
MSASNPGFECNVISKVEAGKTFLFESLAESESRCKATREIRGVDASSRFAKSADRSSL